MPEWVKQPLAEIRRGRQRAGRPADPDGTGAWRRAFSLPTTTGRPAYVNGRQQARSLLLTPAYTKLKRGRLNCFKTRSDQPDSEIHARRHLQGPDHSTAPRQGRGRDPQHSASCSATVGTMLYAGQDWRDVALAKALHDLDSPRKVMPKVNAAIKRWQSFISERS